MKKNMNPSLEEISDEAHRLYAEVDKFENDDELGDFFTGNTQVIVVYMEEAEFNLKAGFRRETFRDGHLQGILDFWDAQAK